MSRPEDISQEAWEAAVKCWDDFPPAHDMDATEEGYLVVLARAILTAKAEEREDIAAWHDHEREVLEQLAVGYDQDVATKWQAQKCLARASNHRIDAAAIRKRGNADVSTARKSEIEG